MIIKMYTKKELKEFHMDLLEIENELIQDFKDTSSPLIKLESNTNNRYNIDTIYGIYSFYFDKDSIFGKFDDIQKYELPDKFIPINGTLYSKKYNINPYTGKFNFHYSEIYDFLDELYRIATVFQD